MTKTMNSNTIKQLNLLYYAKALLMHGWSKGAMYRAADGDIVDPDNPDNPDIASCCLLGALDKANADMIRDDLILSLARSKVRSHLPTSDGWITDFNDAPETTKEEVLAVVDKAINELLVTDQ